MRSIAHQMMKTSDFCSRGSVLLEFGLVLPFVVLMLIGTVEFGRGLRIHEGMAAFGREASSQAFRQCGAELSPRVCTGDMTAADACLTRLKGQLVRVARIAFEDLRGMHFSMSIYTYDEESDSVLWVGISRNELGDKDGTFFNDELVREKYLGLIKAHKVLAITEVWYDFSTIFNVSWLVPSTFYDATIY